MLLFLEGNKASYFYLVSQRWSPPEGSTYFEYYNLPTQLTNCTAFQISSHYSKYFKRLKDSRLVVFETTTQLFSVKYMSWKLPKWRCNATRCSKNTKCENGIYSFWNMISNVHFAMRLLRGNVSSLKVIEYSCDKEIYIRSLPSAYVHIRKYTTITAMEGNKSNGTYATSSEGIFSLLLTDLCVQDNRCSVYSYCYTLYHIPQQASGLVHFCECSQLCF